MIIAAMTQIQNVFITPMGEKSAAVSMTQIMKTGHFCLCGHKMAAWSEILTKLIMTAGTVYFIKEQATIHEWMNNILSFCTKYEILNISAKYK